MGSRQIALIIVSIGFLVLVLVIRQQWQCQCCNKPSLSKRVTSGNNEPLQSSNLSPSQMIVYKGAMQTCTAGYNGLFSSGSSSLDSTLLDNLCTSFAHGCATNNIGYMGVFAQASHLDLASGTNIACDGGSVSSGQ